MSEIDHFDRMIGALHGIPDVLNVKPTTIVAVIPMVGSARTYIIQTYRQKEQGDTIFLQEVGPDGSIRIALPPQVADAIARQRAALTDRARSRAAKDVADERKKAGIVPAFLRPGAKRGGRGRGKK
jgi:hypothetical protein